MCMVCSICIMYRLSYLYFVTTQILIPIPSYGDYPQYFHTLCLPPLPSSIFKQIPDIIFDIDDDYCTIYFQVNCKAPGVATVYRYQ